MGREVKTVSAALSRTNKPANDSYDLRGLTKDGLENVMSGLGTGRDKRSYTRYSFVVPKHQVELESIYRQSWLAKRIVNAVAEDMTREWLYVKFGDDDKDSQHAIEKAEEQFNVKAKTTESLQWARLYGGCIMVIGVKGQNPETPLNVDTLKPGMLQYLHVLDRYRVNGSSQLTTDLSSPNFGLPEYYIVAESTVNFHHTRVIRFNGQKLPYFPWTNNARWDDSELQHVMESLLNCDTTTQSIASLVFEAPVDVIKVDNLAEMLAGAKGDEKVTKRFQLGALMKSINKLLLLDGKETYEKHQTQFTNLDKILEAFRADVAGAADMPVTRLFGQSPGGLNSTGSGDLRNYYDMLKSKQKADLYAPLSYLYRILCLHTLGKVPDDFEIVFNPLWQVSATEQATIDKTNADRDKVYLDAGVITEGVVAKELKERGTYRTLTDADVALAEELSEASHEASLAGMENANALAGQTEGELDELGNAKEPTGSGTKVPAEQKV
jgi:phage-related protein (TIGR01555 family)